MPDDFYIFLQRFAHMLEHQWDFTPGQHAATRAEFVRLVRRLKPPVLDAPRNEPLKEQKA